MNATVIYKIIILIVGLCGSFIGIILLWNKKSLENSKKLQRLQAEKQRDLLKASIDGQELERKRIAEDLHDDIGPLLSVLNIQLSTLEDKEDKVEEIRSTLNDAVKSLRNVSGRMSPAILEELGLNSAIRFIQSRFKKFPNLELSVDWDNHIEYLLNKDEALSVYRVIQESLTNVVKHAKANKVALMGEIREDNCIIIEVQDDGVGFDTHGRKFGLGLTNMRGRIESMKGNIFINSSSSGTSISINIKK